MKSVYIIILFFFLHHTGFSQSNMVYYSDLLHNKIPQVEQIAYISFYSNNLYIIELESSTVGGMDALWTVGPIVSYGTYRHEGEQIILTDNENASKMLLKKIGNDTLYIEKSFGWLKHKIFKLSPGITHDITDDHSEIDKYYRYEMISVKYRYRATSMKKKRDEYVKLNQNIYPLLFGEYEEEDVGVSLWINPNQTYRMMFKGEYNFCFSEGTWVKDGNILMLYDTSFQHPFYLLVGDKTIRCVPFPFCHDTVFKYRFFE